MNLAKIFFLAFLFGVGMYYMGYKNGQDALWRDAVISGAAKYDHNQYGSPVPSWIKK